MARIVKIHRKLIKLWKHEENIGSMTFQIFENVVFLRFFGKLKKIEKKCKEWKNLKINVKRIEAIYESSERKLG